MELGDASIRFLEKLHLLYEQAHSLEPAEVQKHLIAFLKEEKELVKTLCNKGLEARSKPETPMNLPLFDKSPLATSDLQKAWLLASIIEATEDRATIKDLDLRIIGANKALIKAAGKQTLEEILGRTDLEIFGDHPHVRQYMDDEKDAQLLAPGEFILKVEPFIYPDGSRSVTLVKKFPVFSASGQLIATANISRDITELENARGQIQERNRLLDTVIESVDEGISLSNYSGHFEIFNKKLERITGYSREEANSASNFIDCIYHDEKEKAKVYRMLESLKKSKGSNSDETVIVTKHGQTRQLSVFTIIISLSGQEYFLSVYQDITDRKNAEAALIRSEAELRELNATKDKFFSIIAHDLKNPFGSMNNFLDLIVKGYPDFDRAKILKYLNVLHQTAKNGYELLENLLEWSRSQTGRINYNPTRISLRNIGEQTIALYAAMAQEKNISLQNHIPEHLTAFADEYMITTVVRNLLQNALKFSFPLGIITLKAEIAGLEVLFHVEDMGTGISADDLDKLFRIDTHFSRTGTAREAGTGLGLILCKEFIIRNKGRITVKSEQGRGSCFTFSLPRA